MIAKGGEIINIKMEICRGEKVSHAIICFTDLADLKRFIFRDMDNMTQTWFPHRGKTAEGSDDWIVAIQYKSDGQKININQIASDHGVVFSDGTYTCGKKFCAKAVEKWLVDCWHQCQQTDFGFTEDV